MSVAKFSGKHMPPKKSRLNKDEMDQIIAEARRREENNTKARR